MGHHYVPQKHLRNFEDPDNPGFIWLYDKDGGEPKIVNISQVAQSRKFYTEDDEKLLACNIENPANAVIEKIQCNKNITTEERLKLALYIGTMMMRVPYKRRRAEEIMPQALDTTIAQVKDYIISKQEKPNFQEYLLNHIDEMKQKLVNNHPREVLKRVREPLPPDKLIEILFSMTWRVLISSGPQYLITSDNPVFFSNNMVLLIKNLNFHFLFLLPIVCMVLGNKAVETQYFLM